MKRKAPSPPTGEQVSARFAATTLAQRLRQQITTTAQLRELENTYNQIEPYLSGDQQMYLMTQFARHEASIPAPPSPGQTKAEQVRLNVSLTRPVSMDEADPFALDAPTGSGLVNKKRQRMTAEEDIDWSAFDSPSPPPPPPPPPPPSAGGLGGPISI
jgi:hypothetical protein